MTNIHTKALLQTLKLLVFAVLFTPVLFIGVSVALLPFIGASHAVGLNPENAMCVVLVVGCFWRVQSLNVERLKAARA